MKVPKRLADLTAFIFYKGKHMDENKTIVSWITARTIRGDLIRGDTKDYLVVNSTSGDVLIFEKGNLSNFIDRSNIKDLSWKTGKNIQIFRRPEHEPHYFFVSTAPVDKSTISNKWNLKYTYDPEITIKRSEIDQLKEKIRDLESQVRTETPYSDLFLRNIKAMPLSGLSSF